jgi:hypothetical protein
MFRVASATIARSNAWSKTPLADQYQHGEATRF